MRLRRLPSALGSGAAYASIGVFQSLDQRSDHGGIRYDCVLQLRPPWQPATNRAAVVPEDEILASVDAIALEPPCAEPGKGWEPSQDLTRQVAAERV